ncbi:hypothetical protein ON010_g4338 [Phytophthora cinnamomi]|nr:hypothetical protein ON010_g4338 [Phytophthora cinnamomi]
MVKPTTRHNYHSDSTYSRLVRAEAAQELVERRDHVRRLLLRLEHRDLTLEHQRVGRVGLQQLVIQRQRPGELPALLQPHALEPSDARTARKLGLQRLEAGLFKSGATHARRRPPSCAWSPAASPRAPRRAARAASPCARSAAAPGSGRARRCAPPPPACARTPAGPFARFSVKAPPRSLHGTNPMY